MHQNNAPEPVNEAVQLETTELASDLYNNRTEIPRIAPSYQGRDEEFVAAYNHLATLAGKSWKKWEEGLRPDFAATDNWLSDTLGRWPTEKARLAAERQTEEAKARGEFTDCARTIIRERLEIEMGEKVAQPPKKPTPPTPEPPPAKPEAIQFIAPQPEVAPSDEETRLEELKNQQAENRSRATGDPSGHIDHKNPREKFYVAGGFTSVMGVAEGLTGFDITGAVSGSRAGAFGVSILITAGFNLLSVLAAAKLQLVLGYLHARSTYNRLVKEGKTPPAPPDSPDWGTWIVGIGGTILLHVLIFALIRFREWIISRNEYLKGSELAVYAVAAAVEIVFLWEMMVSSHHAPRFVATDRRLTEDIKTQQTQAIQQRKARDARNAHALTSARADHAAKEKEQTDRYNRLVEEVEQRNKSAWAEYRRKLAASEAPVSDPIDEAKIVYQHRIEAANQPLLETLADIEDTIADRIARQHAYHNVRRELVLPEMEEQLRLLITAVLNGKHPFNPANFKQGAGRGKIMSLTLTECSFSLDNPDLEEQLAKFDPTLPEFAFLTEFDDVLQKIAIEERQVIETRKAERERQDQMTKAEAARRRLIGEHRISLTEGEER